MNIPQKQNTISEIMEDESMNIRTLKKQQLIQLNTHFGLIQKKQKYNRNMLIENLLPIRCKIILYNRILLGKEDCPICFQTMTRMNYHITSCGHGFCIECIFKYVTTEKELCPMCRKPYSYEDLIQPFTPDEIDALLSMNEPVTLNKVTIFLKYKKIAYYILYIFINAVLFWKSIYFLYSSIFQQYEYMSTT